MAKSCKELDSSWSSLERSSAKRRELVVFVISTAAVDSERADADTRYPLLWLYNRAANMVLMMEMITLQRILA
jgi:hypothetical protein